MKWYMDKDYIQKHLITYIEFQMKQGYELKDIHNVLIKYGYDEALLVEVIKQVDISKFRAVKTKPNIKELNAQLLTYLENMLIDFIKKEQSQGYTLDVIKRALINYGHHPTMVKKAISDIKHGKVTQIRKTMKTSTGLLLAISLALLVGFIIFLLMETQAPIYIVALSFVPSLATVLMVYAMVINAKSKAFVQMLPVIGVALVVLIFVGLLQISPMLRSVSEPGTILLLNVLLGFLASSLIALFSTQKHKVIVTKDIVEDSNEKDDIPEEIKPEPVKLEEIVTTKKHKLKIKPV